MTLYNESFARLVILYTILATALHSCIVHPCHMVPHCPVSTPAMSTLDTSCWFVHSCKVHPCNMVPNCPLLHCPLPQIQRSPCSYINLYLKPTLFAHHLQFIAYMPTFSTRLDLPTGCLLAHKFTDSCGCRVQDGIRPGYRSRYVTCHSSQKYWKQYINTHVSIIRGLIRSGSQGCVVPYESWGINPYGNLSACLEIVIRPDPTRYER